MKCLRDITKGQFIEICQAIAAHLSPDHSISLVPEAITEGGIRFEGGGYGNALSHNLWYKTMRLRMEDLDWPHINDTTVSEWTNNDEILYPAGSKGVSFLKAFYRAPIWTLNELNLFKSVFESYGIRISKMPKKSDLSGNLIL
jgi:hypothetical protein